MRICRRQFNQQQLPNRYNMHIEMLAEQIEMEFFGNDPKHDRLYSSRKLNVISSTLVVCILSVTCFSCFSQQWAAVEPNRVDSHRIFQTGFGTSCGAFVHLKIPEKHVNRNKHRHYPQT